MDERSSIEEKKRREHDSAKQYESLSSSEDDVTASDEDEDGDAKNDRQHGMSSERSRNGSHGSDKRREMAQKVQSSFWFGCVEATLTLLEYVFAFVVSYRVVTALLVVTLLSPSSTSSLHKPRVSTTTTTVTTNETTNNDAVVGVERDVIEASYGMNLVIAHAITLLWMYYRNRTLSNGIDFLPSRWVSCRHVEPYSSVTSLTRYNRFGISWKGWKLTQTGKQTLLLIVLHVLVAATLQHFLGSVDSKTRWRQTNDPVVLLGLEILSIKTHVREDGSWNVRVRALTIPTMSIWQHSYLSSIRRRCWVSLCCHHWGNEPRSLLAHSFFE